MDTETKHALLRLADLMDKDNTQTNNVGIPVSYGHHLAWLAIVGSHEAWEAEWLRLLRTQSLQAANAWSEQQEQRMQTLIELVYPGGSRAESRSAAEVRALAVEADGKKH
jgi:hypothetical protein